jgi:hypothetical protein
MHRYMLTGLLGVDDALPRQCLSMSPVPKTLSPYPSSQAKSLESSRPLPADLQYRDPDGAYSKEQPFWADVSEAR